MKVKLLGVLQGTGMFNSIKLWINKCRMNIATSEEVVCRLAVLEKDREWAHVLNLELE